MRIVKFIISFRVNYLPATNTEAEREPKINLIECAFQLNGYEVVTLEGRIKKGTQTLAKKGFGEILGIYQ